MDTVEKEEGRNSTEWNYSQDLGWQGRGGAGFDLFSKKQETANHPPARSLNVESNSETDLAVSSNERLEQTDMFAQCTVRFGCFSVPSWAMTRCCDFCAGQRPGWWFARCMMHGGGSLGGGSLGGGSGSSGGTQQLLPGQTAPTKSESGSFFIADSSGKPADGGGGGPMEASPYRMVYLNIRRVRGRYNSCGWNSHCVELAEIEMEHNGQFQDITSAMTVRNCDGSMWWNCYGWSPWDTHENKAHDNNWNTNWKKDYYWHGHVMDPRGWNDNKLMVDGIKFVTWGETRARDVVRWEMYGLLGSMQTYWWCSWCAPAYDVDWNAVWKLRENMPWQDTNTGYILSRTDGRERGPLMDHLIGWHAANNPAHKWEPLMRKVEKDMVYDAPGGTCSNSWCMTSPTCSIRGMSRFSWANADVVKSYKATWQFPECVQPSDQPGFFG